MKSRAAVAWEAGKPLVIEEVMKDTICSISVCIALKVYFNSFFF